MVISTSISVSLMTLGLAVRFGIFSTATASFLATVSRCFSRRLSSPGKGMSVRDKNEQSKEAVNARPFTGQSMCTIIFVEGIVVCQRVSIYLALRWQACCWLSFCPFFPANHEGFPLSSFSAGREILINKQKKVNTACRLLVCWCDVFFSLHTSWKKR